MKLLLFIIIFSFVCSCNEQKLKYDDYECDYSNCNTSKPDTENLKIKLTLNSENTKIPLYIYKGKFEDNIIVDTIFAESESFLYEVSVNNLYTIVAEYKKNDDTIWVIDGTTIETISNVVCDSTCWTTKGGNLNLKLKF